MVGNRQVAAHSHSKAAKASQEIYKQCFSKGMLTSWGAPIVVSEQTVTSLTVVKPKPCLTGLNHCGLLSQAQNLARWILIWSCAWSSESSCLIKQHILCTDMQMYLLVFSVLLYIMQTLFPFQSYNYLHKNSYCSTVKHQTNVKYWVCHVVLWQKRCIECFQEQHWRAFLMHLIQPKDDLFF